jgi:hypothetical protein
MYEKYKADFHLFPIITNTSLAFEKSLESQPLDFTPCGMYLSFSKF